CKLVGFNSSLIELPHDTTEQKILQTVSELNDNEDIDGFIVQLPLPDHIDEQKVTMAIDPEKDVDGFHPASLGKMMLNLPTFISATPMGILKLLERYDIETSGKHCVVIGRSHIVGMPMSVLMARKEKIGNCTVTLTHSRTKNLADHTRRADILIVALGKAQFLKANMIKKGAVVIDVGITRVVDPSKKSGYRLLGDVDFDEVAPLCSYITPVPGGVGPMTIASLLLNTLQAVKRKT
ncbi:MAG: tetrahydrofolate dehydrogenase/cyclohydrolase catalytic domain-containing protein, partial [Vicingaceae bacterium]